MGEKILIAMKVWIIIFGFCMAGSGVTIFVTTLDVERKGNNKKIWDVSLVASLFLSLSGLLILFVALKNNGV